MKKRKLPDPICPLNGDIVRLKEMGNISEIMYSEKKNTNISIQRLDKEHYVDKRTGEVKEFVHMDSRADDKNSVRVTLGKLRDLINTNVINPENCLWITLTYAENMTDEKRLYSDFKKFIMRFRCRGYSFEYIVAMEPQNRGAWHAHLILIFNGKAPFIPNDEISALWGQGFVKTKGLKNIDNVGAYLTAYLGDMDFDEAVESGFNPSGLETKIIENTDENGKKTKKAIVKGARLHLYPPKFNIYRCSRGIKKPDVSYMPYSKAKKVVGDLTPTFERSVEISDDETGFNNTIYTSQFNKKRK